jgi:hypothetical protein
MARIKKIKIPVGLKDIKDLASVISVLNQYFDDIMSAHFQNATEEQVFINYYDGIQDIFSKQRKYKVDNEQPLSNNKIVENHAQAQVDYLTDYLMGEKPKFSSKNLDKLPVEKINTFEGFLVDSGFYTEQREVAKDMFKLGVGVSYQNIDTSLIEEYIDEKGEKKYKYRDDYKKMYDAPFEVSHLDPTMNFVVYSTDVGEEPLFAFNIVNLESPAVPNEFTYKLLGKYRLTIYTREGAFISEGEKRVDNATQVTTYVPLNVDAKSFTYYVRPLPMLPIVEKDLQSLDKILSTGIFEKPFLKISIYKNRRGRYKGIYLWCEGNLGRCKVEPMFATTYNYELIEIKNLKIDVEPRSAF